MRPGAHEMVGPATLELGFHKTLATSGLRGTDLVHHVVESITHHGLEVVGWDKVDSDPQADHVMDAVGLHQENARDSSDVSLGDRHLPPGRLVHPPPGRPADRSSWSWTSCGGVVGATTSQDVRRIRHHLAGRTAEPPPLRRTYGGAATTSQDARGGGGRER